jgi:hypothetical protein
VAVRRDLDAVSFPVVLERLQHEAPGAHACGRLTDYVIRYPITQRLYPEGSYARPAAEGLPLPSTTERP